MAVRAWLYRRIRMRPGSRRNRSRSQSRSIRWRRAKALVRSGRAVEDHRRGKGEADEPVFGPFHHRGHEDPGLKAHQHACAGTEVRPRGAHDPALGDIVESEALRGAVDEQLELAILCGHPRESALVGDLVVAAAGSWRCFLHGSLSQWDGGTAKAAFGA